MALFGRPGDRDDGLMTFAQDAPRLDRPDARQQALRRLLVAAAAADHAQVRLTEAKATHGRRPTPLTRKALLHAAADALDKEVAFDELWESLSKDWFGATPAYAAGP